MALCRMCGAFPLKYMPFHDDDGDSRLASELIKIRWSKLDLAQLFPKDTQLSIACTLVSCTLCFFEK